MRRLLTRLLSAYCADCDHLMWPGQSRCGSRHTTCKHEGDARIAARNGVQMWTCDWCGR